MQPLLSILLLPFCIPSGGERECLASTTQRLLSILLLPFRIPPRGERESNTWFSLLAAIGAPVAHYYIMCPTTYFQLQSFICDAGKSPDGASFYSASMLADPWLSDFPCHNLSSSPLPLEATAINLRSAIAHQPPEQLRWLADRWWWIDFYVQGIHTWPIFGGAVFVIPVSTLLLLLFPNWWVSGGRTLVSMTGRLVACIAGLVFHAICRGRCIHAYAHIDVYTWGCHTLLNCAVIGMVPWRIQVPLTLAEAVIFSLGMLFNVGLAPPSAWWLMQLVGGVCVGGGIGILLAYMVQHFWAHVYIRCISHSEYTSTYTVAAGPVNAVRMMWRGVAAGLRMLDGPRGTAEMVAQFMAIVALVMYGVSMAFWDEAGILLFI